MGTKKARRDSHTNFLTLDSKKSLFDILSHAGPVVSDDMLVSGIPYEEKKVQVNLIVKQNTGKLLAYFLMCNGSIFGIQRYLKLKKDTWKKQIEVNN